MRPSSRAESISSIETGLVRFSNLQDALDSALHAFPVDFSLWDDACYWFAVARDDNRRPALDLVENTEELGLGF